MDFEVKVAESTFVAPSEPTPRQGLWLSSLDLVFANRGHTPLFYLFHSDGTASDFFDVARLKEAMAKALVAFFPLAGRLGVDSSGRIEIDCNGEGALFVVARSDITVDEIKDVKPSPELRRQLVPRIEPSSVVFGCTGDVLQVWRGGVRDGPPPRRHRRHEHVPLLPDMVSLLQGWRPRRRGAPLPRPHPPPRTVPAYRPPRRSLDVLPQARLLRPAGTCRHRSLRHFQRSGRLTKAPLRRREHFPSRERPRMAVRVHRAAASAGFRGPPHLLGQHPAPGEAAPPGTLLRQCVGQGGRLRRRAGPHLGGVGVRRRPHRRRHRSRG